MATAIDAHISVGMPFKNQAWKHWLLFTVILSAQTSAWAMYASTCSFSLRYSNTGQTFLLNHHQWDQAPWGTKFFFGKRYQPLIIYPCLIFTPCLLGHRVLRYPVFQIFQWVSIWPLPWCCPGPGILVKFRNKIELIYSHDCTNMRINKPDHSFL